MNTPQPAGFLKSRLVIGILVLLIVALLAVSIPLVWSLIGASRFPTPIQTDSLGIVEAFPVGSLAANEVSPVEMTLSIS